MQSTFIPFDINDCVLNNTRIDIWQYPLHTLFSEASTLLNQTESDRANRYYFEHHRQRFTIARATLRLILARYTDADPAQLMFTENPYGKPQLMPESLLQFNLSHSGDLALLAVGCGQPLGIDLEFFKGRPYAGIGRQMFSPLENIALNNLSTPLRPLAFFHMWSQKEAFIKACGMGLSYPTQQFDVPALPSTNHMVFDPLNNKTWHMVSFMPKVNCAAALCYVPDVTTIRFIEVRNIHDITR